ncbi:MAG: DUF167 domain-containing protein [Rhodospirillaceae bacterium]
MSAPWYRHDTAAGTVILNLHVQPNARASGFAGLHGDALRVRIAAPAVDDKANGALVDLLRRTLDLPVRAVTIRQGLHSRRKVVVIAGAAPAIIAKLEALASS